LIGYGNLYDKTFRSQEIPWKTINTHSQSV